MTPNDLIKNAPLAHKGHWYEDFEPGRIFKHHWGRTLYESDSIYFSRITLNSCPLYFNLLYAKHMGHDKLPMNPYLVFATVFGLSVEDLSENGIAFLGVDDLKHHGVVYGEDTLSSESIVLERRRSKKYPQAGICTWETRGYKNGDVKVISFRRTNLIKLRDTTTDTLEV